MSPTRRGSLTMRERDVGSAVGLGVFLLLLFGLLGGGMMGSGMMGWGGLGFGLLGWVTMMFFWALVIGGIALLVVWLVRQGQPPSASDQGNGRTALDILRERYARGELTREEYEQVRRDLQAN